ncbi:MAG: GNAT family N-acetyltransferase [Alphaproteobacteria bacterium]|nr:GNAT family N-acetyltransferase [Alphaproteobacteria bacterium]
MSIETFRYTAGHAADIEDGLAAYGLQSGGEHRNAYFDETLAAPDRLHDAVFAARDADRRLAMAFVMSRPVLEDDGRLVMLMLPPGENREGDDDAAAALGHALHDAAGAFLAERGISRVAQSIQSDSALQQRIVGERGFEIVMPYHNLQWQGDDSPLAAPHVEGVTYEIYTGGDRSTNEQIEALWRRAFATEPLHPDLSPAWIETSVETLGIWYLVAHDETSGRVVGLSEAGPENFFSGIAVARSHWGTSLADALVLRSCNEFMSRGHDRLHSMTRKTNAPSLKLQDRLGWEIYADGDIWVSPESAG